MARPWPEGVVIRPTFGTDSLPRDPTALLAHAPQDLTLKPDSLPLLITIVRNEAGSVTQSLFPEPVPPSPATLGYVLSGLIGPERAATILSSPSYSFSEYDGKGTTASVSCSSVSCPMGYGSARTWTRRVSGPVRAVKCGSENGLGVQPTRAIRYREATARKRATFVTR